MKKDFMIIHQINAKLRMKISLLVQGNIIGILSGNKNLKKIFHLKLVSVEIKLKKCINKYLKIQMEILIIINLRV